MFEQPFPYDQVLQLQYLKTNLLYPVEIERPNPQYAALMQEQLGGANGELKAAMQYMSQSFRIEDPDIKDLFLDIAAEENEPAHEICTFIFFIETLKV